MTLEAAVQIGLAACGLVGFLLLFGRRLLQVGAHTQFHRRLLLVDLTLVVAGLELVLDAIHEVLPMSSDLGYAAYLTAIAARGGIIISAITLIITFPGDNGFDPKRLWRKLPADRSGEAVIEKNAQTMAQVPPSTNNVGTPVDDLSHLYLPPPAKQDPRPTRQRPVRHTDKPRL